MHKVFFNKVFGMKRENGSSEVISDTISVLDATRKIPQTDVDFISVDKYSA